MPLTSWMVAFHSTVNDIGLSMNMKDCAERERGPSHFWNGRPTRAEWAGERFRLAREHRTDELQRFPTLPTETSSHCDREGFCNL